MLKLSDAIESPRVCGKEGLEQPTEPDHSSGIRTLG